MSGVEVADLYATLGVRPDKAAFSSGDRLISGLSTGLKVLAGLGAVKWFSGVISGVVNTADHLDELSQSVGVNVEELQALGYAAGFSGVSVDQLGDQLGKFAKNADAAANGGKKQSQAFKSVGVDAKALANGTLSMEDALAKVADRFSTMPDGTKKTILSMQLFGKSGKTLIPFLNAGSTGIKEMTAKARELGIVMDRGTIDGMVKLADQQDELSAGWQGMKNELVAALVPALSEAASGALKFMKANRKAISQRVIQFFKILAGAIKVVAKIIGTLIDAVDWLAKSLGVSIEVIGGVVVAFMALTKILGIVSAIGGSALGGLVIPLLLIGALVAGLMLLFGDLTLDEVKKKIDEFATWAAGKMRDLRDWATDKAGKAGKWLADKVPGGHAIGKGAASVLGGIMGFDMSDEVPQSPAGVAAGGAAAGGGFMRGGKKGQQVKRSGIDPMTIDPQSLADQRWSKIDFVPPDEARLANAIDKINAKQDEIAQNPTAFNMPMSFTTTINEAENIEEVRALLVESHQKWAEEIAEAIDAGTL